MGERMKKEIQEIKSKDGNKFELLLEGEKRRVKDILEIQNKHKIELKYKDNEIEKLKESHKNELIQKDTEISNFKTKHKSEIEEVSQEYEETVNEVMDDNKKLKVEING